MLSRRGAAIAAPLMNIIVGNGPGALGIGGDGKKRTGSWGITGGGVGSGGRSRRAGRVGDPSPARRGGPGDSGRSREPLAGVVSDGATRSQGTRPPADPGFFKPIA